MTLISCTEHAHVLCLDSTASQLRVHEELIGSYKLKTRPALVGSDNARVDRGEHSTAEYLVRLPTEAGSGIVTIIIMNNAWYDR